MKINRIKSQDAPGRGPRGAGAFSLIECIVAISVIMIGFVTIFGSMTMGFSITELSRENLRATQIILDKMEGVRLYSWTQITNSSFLQPTFTNWFYETNNIGLTTAKGNGVLYTGVVAVTSVPFSASYSNNMVQVTVSVGWTSAQGGLHHTRSSCTFVSMSGLQNYVFNN